MSTQWKLIGGPSKFDLMLGTFDKKVVTFTSRERKSFWVRVMSVKMLDDDSEDAWVINGYLADRDGHCRDRRSCGVVFSSKTREGTLDDFGPEEEKEDAAFLDKLSNNQLRDRIRENRELASDLKDDLDEYIKRQTPHDALIVECLATKRMVEVSLHSQLDHTAYTILRSRRSAVTERR